MNIAQAIATFFLCLSPVLPQETGALERGRECCRRFYIGELDPLWQQFTQEMKSLFKTQETFAQFQAGAHDQLGPEIELLEERVERQGPVDVYVRIARFEKLPKPVQLTWSFDAQGNVSGALIRPVASEAESKFLDYQTKAALRLPFEGEWYVFWGGRSLEQNYHAASADQRFAYDLIIRKDGKSHEGDGKRNEDYHCFDVPILAPAKGVVRKAVDGIEDNVPGVMNAKEPPGNYVVIDHGNEEFSLLAHFKKGSVAVREGEEVESGALLGLCGNSGNSSEPHLHYHLQNTAVFSKGMGLPAQFQDYTADGERVDRGEPVRGQTVQLDEPAPRERERASARAWEHESSDLEPNARIHFGALPNGLRYAWMKNSEPKQRSYARIHVDIGALAEEENELGLAHFLEHMAFNGSENFAAGTLIEWFQERGMDFGAHLNAMTSHSETIYMLDLPQSDEKTLREGFSVLRDWADKLLLEAEEIDKEKGVVDGEDAAGKSAFQRVFDRIMQVQYEATRYPLRDVIGKKEVRDAFSSESVRDFYEQWYRPENMTLILVGDLGELDPTKLIEESFAGIEPPQSPVELEPDEGEGVLRERFFCLFEPELPSVYLQLELLTRYRDEPDNAETRTKDLDLDCAQRMLNLRFSELVKQESTPFLSADVDEVSGFRVYDGQVLGVESEPDKWKEAFAAAHLELRRALEFGFQEAELKEVRADWLRALDEAVERESTRHSGAFVGEMLAAAEHRSVPTDAALERKLIRPVLEALDVETCHAAFREAWAEGIVNFFTIGNLDLGAEAEKVLKEVYEAAQKSEVEKGAEISSADFAYSSDPEKTAPIATERHVEDLDAWLFTFENGVQLNVKQTDFKERQILVTARLAEGLLTLEPKDFATGWVGSQVINLAGLGAHTSDELRRLMAGKEVGGSFGWSNDAFMITGQTTAEDLVLQLELLCASLQDPGWRDDGIRLLRDRLPLIFERLQHVSSGPLLFEFLPALFHGDLRFSEMPPREKIESVSMETIKAWLSPQLANGPLEVTIVGDVDVAAVRSAAERTLGLLPERRERLPYTERRKVEPPAKSLRMERTIETEDDKSFVFIVFPTADGLVTERARSIGFLGDVVQDRLRILVREELGAAYSPGASANTSTVFPGVGTLILSAQLDPEKVDTFVEGCLRVAKKLQEEGVGAEEVKRLAEPKLKEVRDSQRRNGYWTSVLAEAQSRPETLDDARTLEAFYRDIKPERINELAKAYLDPESASILIVNPAEDEEGAPEVEPKEASSDQSDD